MANLDLDALVGVAEPITFSWKGETFRLGDDLDLGGIRPILKQLEDQIAADDAAGGDGGKGLAILDTLWDFTRTCFYDDAEFLRFQATRPGPRVLMALVSQLPGLYGFESLGESGASSDGSPDTGTGSTPTSDGSTTSPTPDSPSGDDPVVGEPDPALN